MSSAGRSAVGNSGMRFWFWYRRGSSARRGGRSLAINTAIHGSGIATTTMARETRPLCQMP